MRRAESAHLIIRWRLDEDTPIEGVAGIDSERVYVSDLRKWARRRQRQVRRDIRRAHRADAFTPTRAEGGV